MPPGLLFYLSWLLIVSGVFWASRGTETELADSRRSRGGPPGDLGLVADPMLALSKRTVPPENMVKSTCVVPASARLGIRFAVPGSRHAEHLSRREDDLGAVFAEELHWIIASKQPAGELRPAQTRAHLDLQAHRRVGGIPGKVTASRPGNDDLTGCGHDLDAIDGKRCPALKHLELFLHVRVDVLGGSVTGPRPGREHGQGFGCLRHELDAFSRPRVLDHAVTLRCHCSPPAPDLDGAA
jgi:hypothetical protein